MHNGSPANHSDTGAPSSAPNDGDYSVSTSFEEYKKKDEYPDENVNDSDKRKYGAIEERVWDTLFTSPVDGVETLKHRTALTAQFHAGNRDHWEDRTPYQNDGGVLYDLKILELCNKMLAEEGIDLSSDVVASEDSERRVRACFLREARGQNGTDLHDSLSEPNSVSSEVHQALGYSGPSDVPSYSTLQRAYAELKQDDGIEWTDFEAAVTRAVYAVVRAGIVAPGPVMDEYGFKSLEPPLDEAAVSRAAEQNETQRSVRKLVDRTLDPIDFDRDSKQTSHEISAFIAACAASAETDKGFEELKDVCDWNYPRENIPGGGWTRNYVTERLSLDSQSTLAGHQTGADRSRTPVIDDQFDAVHRRMLNLAGEFGFWEGESINIAVDMFHLDWTGDSLDVTIGRPPKQDNDNVTEQWTFVIAICVDTKRRFALGARLLTSKSEYPSAVHEILSNARECVNIGTVMIDNEIVSGELIETLQEFTGPDWIISAPDHAIIKGLKRLTPENHAGFARDVKWNTSLRPNVVTYPVKGSNPKTVQIDPDNVAVKEIQHEGGEKIRVPLKNNSVPSNFFRSKDSLPWLRVLYDDLESLPGVGRQKKTAAYFTGRSIPERSASGIRFEYVQRWSIEDAIGRIIDHFLSEIESSDPNQRLFGVQVAVLLYNWYIFINRSLSPHFIRLDVCEKELRKAIQDVGFLPEDHNFE